MRPNPDGNPTPASDLPLVSVIIPSLNQVRFVDAAIRSVLAQTYPRIELLVVDGGSSDGSLEIIRSYADRISYLVSRPDHGQAEAINEGLAHASGRYVAWLNSDDIYLPECIAAGVDELERHPSAGMAYARTQVIDSAGVQIGFFKDRPFDFIELLSSRQIIPQQASLFRRSAIDAVGPLDESLHYALDHELFIRLAYAFPVRQISRIHAAYRISDANKGALNSSAWAGELIRAAEKCLQAHPEDARLAALRPQVMADVYHVAGCHLLDDGFYSPARGLFNRAANTNPRIRFRPLFWLHTLRTFIGRPGNALFISLKILLARLKILDTRYDWWTALALRGSKSTLKS